MGKITAEEILNDFISKNRPIRYNLKFKKVVLTAMQEHTKQHIEALRSELELKMKDEYYNIYAINKLFNQFLENIN